VVAVIAIGAFAAVRLISGPAKVQPAAPGTKTSAGILVPATGTPTNVSFQRTLGRPDAPVRLLVWSDFQCAGCKDFAESSLPHLITDFVIPGKLRIEFRDLAVVGPESAAAAAAARCADQQGKFWPYHDVLFANQGPEETGLLLPARLKDMADAIGLDRTAFDVCLPSGDVFNAVQTETAQGKTRGDAAPILDFTSVVISGSEPYDTLKQTVEQLLANAPTPAPPAASTPPAATP
jgi:protein-disulfide isomerase